MSDNNSFDQNLPTGGAQDTRAPDNAAEAFEDHENSAFIAALLPALRTVERLAPDFDDRVMTIARSEAPRLYRRKRTGRPHAWWNRTLVLEIRPLAGLAMAAGLAGIIIVSALAAGAIRIGEPASGQFVTAAGTDAHRTDTVHVVRFVFVDGDARSVSLVGDFNGWTPHQTQLEPIDAPGTWTVSVALPAGRHEYAFLVNGQRWTADPFAPVTTDEFDLESSVIIVGSQYSSIG